MMTMQTLKASIGRCAIALVLTLGACGDDDGPVAGVGGDAGFDSGGTGGEGMNDGGDNDGQSGAGGDSGSGGNAGNPPPCEDADQDGHRAASCGGDDCDDDDDAIHPGATELCDNSIDDDCSYATSDHPDLDGDGFDCLSDCDDTLRSINPGRPETCGNAINDDCNGATPDVSDLDGDGFSCDMDCDETRIAINPGADEVCGTDVDEDCDPTTLDVGDNDGDGIDCSSDCDDTDANLPTATYYCGLSFNYFEGFEAGDGGWTVSGENASWEHGTPQGDVIESAANGQRAWITGIAAGYNDSEASFLTSPSFDFSLLTEDPVLRFSRIVWIGSGDGVWLEVSTDGGVRWNRLPETSIDQNMYGDDDDLGFTDSEQWLTALTRLTGTAGETDVRIRVVMFSDESSTYEGFGFDDVQINDHIYDASVDSVTLPVARCGDRSAEAVTVVVTNRSSATLPALHMAYSIDNQAPLFQTFDTSLAAGASRTLAFDTAANLSAVGRHTVRAWISLDQLIDEDRSNDTAETSTHTFALAGAPDYVESFEQNGGNWVGLGTRSSWARGTPIGDPIDGAADGNYAWDTNPYGVHNDEEDSALTSPCFDFSTVTQDPVLAFAHAFSLDTDAQHTVEVALDGGAFVKLGADNSPSGVRWYNDIARDAWNGRSGMRGQWRSARHTLTGTAGRPLVQVRFRMIAGADTLSGAAIDDVRIARELVDATVTTVTVPEIECQGRATSVVMRLHNGGNQTLSNFDVSYQLDALTAVTETVSAEIAANGNLDYTFTTPLTITGLGAHTLTVRTLADSQISPEGTSIERTIVLQPRVNGASYLQDFESGAGGWIALGTGNQWQLGIPQASFADVITEAASGQYAWVTRLYGAYGPSWNGDLVSPCVDVSALTADPFLRFDHIFDSERADPMWLEMTTDGVTWSKVVASGGGTGWYNDTDNDDDDASVDGDEGPQWSGNSDANQQWHLASEVLPDSAGAANLQLRFRFRANSSNTGFEGHGIDRISLGTPFTDGAVEALELPELQCTGVAHATFQNTGTAPINGFDVTYQLDAGSVTTTHVNAMLTPGQRHVHTLPNLPLGTHTIVVGIVVGGDTVATNNSATDSTEVLAGVSAVGYTHGFETNPVGWNVTAGEWERGTPTKTFITGAATGTGAWVTNLDGVYSASTYSALTTVCFDFGGFTDDPQLSFSHIFQSEMGYDGGYVDVSFNAGARWITLGAQGEGSNWYNASADWWTGASGAAGVWRTALYPLNYFAGERAVMFRFAHGSDSSEQRDGMGIDNFAIVP